MRQTSGTRLSPPSAATISAIMRWRGLISPCSPRIVTCSSPLRPSDCQDVPSSKHSGSTPIPIRLDRWMRSNDWQMTARMPSKMAPFPAARGPRAVLLAGEDHERNLLPLVAHGGVVDRHALPRWEVHGHAALDSRHHLVLEPDIGEGTAHHHFVVAAPCAVLIEVGRLD